MSVNYAPGHLGPHVHRGEHMIPRAWCDEVVAGVAEQKSDGLWRVVYVDFGIAGEGESLHEAFGVAGTSFAEYLILALERSEFSLDDLKRPISRGSRFRLHSKALLAWALTIVDHDEWTRTYPLSVPLCQAVYLEEQILLGPHHPSQVDEDEALLAEGYEVMASELLAIAHGTATAQFEALPEK